MTAALRAPLIGLACLLAAITGAGPAASLTHADVAASGSRRACGTGPAGFTRSTGGTRCAASARSIGDTAAVIEEVAGGCGGRD